MSEPPPSSLPALARSIGRVLKSLSGAVASCPQSSGGPHRFQGYPKERGRCRFCGTERVKA